jgi:hypothetical protein
MNFWYFFLEKQAILADAATRALHLRPACYL